MVVLVKEEARKGFEIYTRVCKRCKKYFETKSRRSKICNNCNKQGQYQILRKIK